MPEEEEEVIRYNIRSKLVQYVPIRTVSYPILIDIKIDIFVIILTNEGTKYHR